MAPDTPERTVADILIKTGSVSFSPENPFKYASGLLSPIFIDCRQISSYPDERETIVDFLIKEIDVHVWRENIDIIAGTASSGISLATLIAERLEKPMIYVRSKAKEHGKGRQIEGAFKKGKRVLLLTDLISTADDVQIAVEALKSEEMQILACLAIYDNRVGSMHAFLEKNKIPLYTLTNLNALTARATELLFISSPEKKILDAWAENPEKWNDERIATREKIEAGRKKKISEILLKIGGVTLSPSKPYKYTSGILSPIYTDNRLLISYPAEWKEVIDAFADAVISKIGRQNINVIAGTDSAGISHAAYLASRLHLPMAYIKSEETPYGKRRKIEGNIKAGDKVVIIEDLISTGKSSIAAAKTAREAGAVVDWCLSIFDYGLAEAKKAFSEAKCTLLSMTDLSALLDVALEKKIISQAEKKMIISWQKDPNGWGEKK